MGRPVPLHSVIALVFAFASLVLAGQPPVAPAPPEAADQGWPRQFEAQTSTVRVYQPQVESWPDFARIYFRSAICVAPKGGGAKTYGILRVSADAKVSVEDRLVVLTGRKIESVSFPDVDAEEATRLEGVVLSAMPQDRPLTISLDRLVADLDIKQVKVKQVDVNLAPPRILASQSPAVMVIFMGEPRFKPAGDSGLMYAINTNWDVFLDPSVGRYYLLNEGSWLTTADLDKGPWTASGPLPAGLSRLPDDENWSDVRAALPGVPAGSVPAVLVTHEPAELIVLNGAPEFRPIPGTALMAVVNTESDLFYNGPEKQFYLLTAGRWFKAAALTGPWSPASAALPDDFKKIPEDSEAADVRVSVPGTPEANEAVILASVPNKATVNSTEVTVNVTYEGQPQFKPVEGTTVQYAYNTPSNVFLVDGRYYCCHNAVWFESPTPTGVWVVCTAVPAAIYTIPPSSPKHNVTYVYVYESTPTTVVTGYTAGYSGATVAATGAVMFGLGVLVGAALADDDDCCWHYHCHSHFFSYGCGVRYHGGCGGFVAAGHWYGPYGGAGRVAAYNPATGVYQRGAYVYGPRGAAGYRAAYNPATGNAGWRAGGTTPYGSWSRGAVTNGDEWIRGGQRSGVRGSVSGVQGSGGAGVVRAENRWGNGVTVARDQDGDLYAGRDGNVYKRTDDGWEQQRGSPRAVAPDAPRPAQPATQVARPAPADAGVLQQEARARGRGERAAARTQQFQRSGGSSPGRGRRGN